MALAGLDCMDPQRAPAVISWTTDGWSAIWTPPATGIYGSDQIPALCMTCEDTLVISTGQTIPMCSEITGPGGTTCRMQKVLVYQMPPQYTCSIRGICN